MRVTILASGSRGNSALFDFGAQRILVDAGIPLKTFRERLSATGARPPTAVVITHAHSDHHAHAEPIAAHYNIPVYVSEASRRMLRLRSVAVVKVFGPKTPFMIGDVNVSPLSLPHDAAQVCIKLSAHGHCAAIATDLGEVPPSLPGHLAGVDTLLIESNHDHELLWKGPYPFHLKKRIASARGHLSNDQTHGLLRTLSPATRTVVLMHLSEANNLPALARETAADALADHPARLLVASQDTPVVIETDPLPPRGQLSLF